MISKREEEESRHRPRPVGLYAEELERQRQMHRERARKVEGELCALASAHLHEPVELVGTSGTDGLAFMAGQRLEIVSFRDLTIQAITEPHVHAGAVADPHRDFLEAP